MQNQVFFMRLAVGVVFSILVGMLGGEKVKKIKVQKKETEVQVKIKVCELMFTATGKEKDGIPF